MTRMEDAMSETMLEKAARALAEKMTGCPVFADEWRPWIPEVRAVLMAVRDLTPEMRQAIFDDRDGFVHEIDIPGVWGFGIDAILAQEPGV